MLFSFTLNSLIKPLITYSRKCNTLYTQEKKNIVKDTLLVACQLVRFIYTIKIRTVLGTN